MLTLLLFAVFASVWKTVIALICGGTAALAMALVKAPAGGVAASGTIGGQVYARNRAGNYARAWAKPVNPKTPRQTFVRNAFAATSVAWGMLTQAEIDTWDSYAAQLTRFNRLGEPYTPKGRQIYQEVNSNMQLVGNTELSSPAAATDSPGFTIPEPVIDDVTQTGSAISSMKLQNYSSLVLPGLDTGHFVIDATPPLDPKITNPQRYFRFVTILTDATLTNPLETAYNAAFGTPNAPAGMNVWVRVRLVDDTTGLSSPQQIGVKAIT